MKRRSSKIFPKGYITSFFAITAICLLLFVILEGSSSILLTIAHWDNKWDGYGQYDERLGWVSKPNTDLPDYFGSGNHLITNSRGFRNNQEFQEKVKDGTLRVVCSGDSFTFGEGVANDETWCHKLTELVPNLESLNLGQPGYGVDQAYLRYLREGASMGSHLHIFAFIGPDLYRMGTSVKYNFGKPVLRLNNEQLVVQNVPVPKLRHQIARNITKADFQMVTFGKKVLGYLAALVKPSINWSEVANKKRELIRPIAVSVFKELVQESSSKGIDTLFVYLPIERDLYRDLQWRKWTKQVMSDLGYRFIDLTPTMRHVSALKALGFFINDGVYAGHYSEEGNLWVAEQLAKGILAEYSKI